MLEAKDKTLVCTSVCENVWKALPMPLRVYVSACACVCVCSVLEAGYVASIRVVAAGGGVRRWAARLRGGAGSGVRRRVFSPSAPAFWRLYVVELVLHSHL